MLDPDRQRKLEELFQVAVTVPGAELPAFFARHCAGDDELRRELQSLLDHDEDTRDFLQSPVVESPVSLPAGDSTADETTFLLRHSIPERVGRYHVLDKIGAGGMGAVYLAEQQRPVRRRVALKIVRAEMDGERVLERFEHERQTLAMMDHPGIAGILDAGTTNSGRPFFVMEYVPGESITDHCELHRARLDERVALLAKVCDAVQHAHQKGIVHRDLKPSNVIVAERDGAPEPKVIDFGIAASVGSRRHLGSGAGADAIGTLHYMAPEQADPANLDVDTRADVWSLGVLAYELLVGVLPFRTEGLRGKSSEEARRVLAEQALLPPSERAAALPSHEAEPLARARRLSRRRWIRALSGDLDAIVARAMARDRRERYASASELAADLRRYLALEPVAAGRDTLAGRVSRYVRRHRVGVLSGGLVALAVVAAAATSSWLMLEARANERLARHAMREAVHSKEQAEGDRRLAERAFRQADAVRRFLLETISLADPRMSLDPDMKLETVLDLAGEHVGEDFRDDPEGEASLRHALGRAFHSIGEPAYAELHLRRALQLREGLLSTPLEELHATTRLLAQVYLESDGRDARPTLRQAARLAVELVARSDPDLAADLEPLVATDLVAVPDAELRARLADLRERLRRVPGRADAPAAAPASPPGADEAAAGSALGSAQRLAAADVLDHAARVLGDRRGRAVGVDLLDAALELRTAELLAVDLELADTRGRLADLLVEHGDPERAEALARSSIFAYERVLPPDHFRVQLARSRLGGALAAAGRGDRAHAVLTDSHASIVAARGPFSPAAAEAAARLVRYLDGAGPAASANAPRATLDRSASANALRSERDRDARADALRPELAAALARVRNAPARWPCRRAAFGADLAPLVEALDRLDELRRTPGEDASDPAELSAAFAAVLEARRAHLPADAPLAALVARALVDLLPGRPEAPAATRCDVAREVVDVLGERAAELPELVAEALLELAADPAEEARREERLRRALSVMRDARGPLDRSSLWVESRLARSLWARGRHAEVEASLVDTWLACRDELGVSHEHCALALTTLRDHFADAGRPGDLAPYLREHLEGRIAEDVNAERLRALAWYALRPASFDPAVVELALLAGRRADALTGVASWHVPAALLRLGRPAEADDALAAVRPTDDPREWAFRGLVSAARGRPAEARGALARLEAEPVGPTLGPLVAEVRAAVGAERR